MDRASRTVGRAGTARPSSSSFAIVLTGAAVAGTVSAVTGSTSDLPRHASSHVAVSPAAAAVLERHDPSCQEHLARVCKRRHGGQLSRPAYGCLASGR